MQDGREWSRIRIDPRFRIILLLACLTVVGLGLRWPGFATREVWYDEAEQFYISSARTWSEVLPRLIIADRNPPGYALVAWASLRFGDGEVALRLPSLLAGLGTITAAYLAGSRWRNDRAGFVMAALAAVLPPWVCYAREARPYAGGLLVNLLFLHAVALHLQRPGRRSFAYLWLTALTAVVWQYANLFVVGGGLLAGALGAERNRRRGWSMVMGGVLSLAVLQMVAVEYPQIRSQGIRSNFLLEGYFSWGRPLDALRFLVAKPAELLDFLTFTVRDGLGLRLLSLAAWLPIVYGMIVSWRRGGTARTLLVATVLPVVALMFLAGLRLHPFGGIRHCLPLAPGILLRYAAGLEDLRRSTPRLVALSPIILVGLSLRGTWALIPGWHAYDTMDIVAQVEARAQPGDVAAFSTMAGSVRRYYSRGTQNRIEDVVYFDEATDSAGPGEVRPRDRPSPQAIETWLAAALTRSTRLWLITPDDNTQGIQRMIGRHAHKTGDLRGRHARASLWIANNRGRIADGKSPSVGPAIGPQKGEASRGPKTVSFPSRDTLAQSGLRGTPIQIQSCLSAISIALSIPLALFTVSSNSADGSLSKTTPPPAWT